jgi:hypothetical protein
MAAPSFLFVLSNFFRWFRRQLWHSTVWLWLYRLGKTGQHRILGSSQLERLCTPQPTSIAYSTTATSIWSLLIPSPLIQWTSHTFTWIMGRLWNKPTSASTSVPSSEEDSSVPVHVSYATVYKIDRALMYSRQLALYRHQLESRDASDVFTPYLGILQTKGFPMNANPQSLPVSL